MFIHAVHSSPLIRWTMQIHETLNPIYHSTQNITSRFIAQLSYHKSNKIVVFYCNTIGLFNLSSFSDRFYNNSYIPVLLSQLHQFQNLRKYLLHHTLRHSEKRFDGFERLRHFARLIKFLVTMNNRNLTLGLISRVGANLWPQYSSVLPRI